MIERSPVDMGLAYAIRISSIIVGLGLVYISISMQGDNIESLHGTACGMLWGIYVIIFGPLIYFFLGRTA
ncbi:MAG: hypothetical protein KKC68_07525 [Candidatus Thermoplasmatota archaeon]|nr:hypothetical protein [Candidatus Thermoplasmatota archaeon]MBU1941608.1 hypothetical protein [Candidatus Thermoplasmatota archaeon]